MYLFISANVFWRGCFIFPVSVSTCSVVCVFSPMSETLEVCADSKKVTENCGWSLCLDATRFFPLASVDDDPPWSFFFLTYWVAFPRNMILFKIFTEVRLWKKKSKHRWKSMKTTGWSSKTSITTVPPHTTSQTMASFSYDWKKPSLKNTYKIKVTNNRQMPAAPWSFTDCVITRMTFKTSRLHSYKLSIKVTLKNWEKVH